MNAHNILQTIFRGAVALDPGNAGTINVDRSPHVVGIVSATSETRTLARPTTLLSEAFIYMKTDGGDVTLTITGGYNEDGDTTFLFDDPGEFIHLKAGWDGSTYYWRKISDHTTGLLTQTEAGFLSGITAGTGAASKAMVLNSSGNITMPGSSTLSLSIGALAALGTNAATAAPITQQISAVTAADGTKGVALPAAAAGLGPVIVINTDVDAMLPIYPVSGGNDNINGLAEDAALEIGPGEMALFAATSATQWYTPVPHNRFNGELVTATNVITAAESGKTFFLHAAGGFTSTLPAPALGMMYRFIVKTAPTGASYVITTTGGSNLLYGMMVERAGGAGVAGAAQDTFNFVVNQSIIGDWVEFFSDGTNWYYHGMVDVAAGNTVSAT